MKMLDLFCGEGLAAWGYWLSGRFSEIVGIDINSNMSTRYSFDFIAHDAIQLDYVFLSQFDFIHASPPCQAYSKATPHPEKHPRLIAATHLMLHASHKPYVIENVEGSSRDLRPNLVLSGTDFNLPSIRRRYFHLSTISGRCTAHISSSVNTHQQISDVQRINIHGSLYVRRSDVIRALGLEVINENRLNRITLVGMKQGIPPAFTRFIAEMLFPAKYML